MLEKYSYPNPARTNAMAITWNGETAFTPVGNEFIKFANVSTDMKVRLH